MKIKMTMMTEVLRPCSVHQKDGQCESLTQPLGDTVVTLAQLQITELI